MSVQDPQKLVTRNKSHLRKLMRTRDMTQIWEGMRPLGASWMADDILGVSLGASEGRRVSRGKRRMLVVTDELRWRI
jgi:hypothetical protein